ncbi:MAG: hypothetical protein ACUVXB_16630 [Bryobacteraceae bacterium]
MAASAEPSQPNGVCLILNLGTQEPRLQVNGVYLHLGEDVPEAEAQTVAQDLNLGGSRGLWFAARRIWQRWEEREDFRQRLSFPIARPALDYALRDSRSAQIDLLLLIATNASSRPRTYEPRHASNDDTIFAAQLLEKFIRTSEWNDKVREIQIVEVRDRPHLYSAADRQISQHPNFQQLGRFARIYVSQSPGLPMVNQAVLRHSLRAARQRVVPFQIEEPDDPGVLLTGGLSERVVPVPTVDLLYDAAYEVLKKLLDRFDYRGAIDLVDSLPERNDKEIVMKLLKKAYAIWRWDTSPPAAPMLGAPGDWLGKIVSQLWMMSYTLDALVKRGDFTEVLWRFHEALSQLRACAAAKIWSFPQLATQNWIPEETIQAQCPNLLEYGRGGQRGFAVNYLVDMAIRVAKNRNLADWACWSARVSTLESVINFLDQVRNEIIHRARFFDKTEFVKLSKQQNALDQPGEWLRKRLWQFCGIAQLQPPAELSSFDEQNQEIRRAAGLM